MKLCSPLHVAALASVACSTVAMSLPTRDEDIEHMKSHHRLTQVPGGPRLPGPLALLHAHRKHNLEPSSDLIAAAASAAAAVPKGAGFDTGAPTQYDNGWLWPVTMGKSNLSVVFDTGSADLWGFSTLTPTGQRNGHKLYNPSATGAKINGETFNAAYGKGAASGQMYADKVVAGDVTATVVAVGAATSVATFLSQAKADGIMGFGFSDEGTCSPQSCATFFDQVYQQLPQPVFAVALKHAAPGTWDFGFVDKSLYTGSIVYTEQMNEPLQGSWGIFVQGASINNDPITKVNFYALVDTGTTLYLTFQDYVDAYYAVVPGAVYDSTQAGVVFPCSSTSSLPNLNLFIDGQKRTMPGAYGLYVQINSTYCFGSVQAGTQNGVAILGDAFLKSQYVIYNPVKNIVGFAQQKGVAI